MKVLEVISTTTLFLLFGATVPTFAQEEHHEESAKPAQHEEQAKPAAQQEQAKHQEQEQQANLQSRSKRNRKSSNSRLSHRSKSNKRRAKKRTSRSIHNKARASNRKKRINTNSRSRLSRTKRRVSSTNNKPMPKRSNHRANTHGMVRKISTDTNITKVVLVLTITPALRKTVGANTAHAGSTLTAAIGFMQEHIRHGFTSGTCTSLWDRMGYGMQLHMGTLL